MKNNNIFEESYTLSNGKRIPKLGLGTWFIPDTQAAAAVCEAVAMGYRHIDTAQAYQNERGVGEGIRTCGIPREELFVTTKLAAELKTYDEAREAVEGSLAQRKPRSVACTGGRLQVRKTSGDWCFQFQAAGYREYSFLVYGCAYGQSVAGAYRQYPCRIDGILPGEKHFGRGIFSGSSWRNDEASGCGCDGCKISSDHSTALHSL